MAMDCFQYPALQGPLSIRLLRLHPSEDRDAPVHIDFVDLSLPSMEAGCSQPLEPSYEALSYVWGERADGVSVFCGGSRIGVTPNCLAALKMLRLASDERTLWVDAICIDQSSIPERNHQVERMADIYMGARQVVVWLGSGDEFTDRLFTYLNGDMSDLLSLSQRVEEGRTARGVTLENLPLSELDARLGLPASDPAFRDLVWPIMTGLQQFTSSSYFTRMWTIQELVLARKRLLVCGDSSTSWDKIKERVDRLASFLDGLAKVPIEAQHENSSPVTHDAEAITSTIGTDGGPGEVHGTSSHNLETTEPLSTPASRSSEPSGSKQVEEVSPQKDVSTPAGPEEELPSRDSGSLVGFAATAADIWALSNGRKTKSFQDPALYTNSPTPFHYFCALYKDFSNIFNLVRKSSATARIPEPVRPIKLERVKISAVLSCTRHARATDARDKVFALYGLLKCAGTEMVAPDYQKPVSEVYIEASRLALRKEVYFQQFRMMNVPPLSCLFHIASWNRRGDLPSWVPDWGDPAAVIPRLGVVEHWKAAGASKEQIAMSNQDTRLIVRGIALSTITKRFSIAQDDFSRCDALVSEALDGFLRASTVDSIVFTLQLRRWVSEVSNLPSIHRPADIEKAWLEMLGVFYPNSSIDLDSRHRWPEQMRQFHEWFGLLATPDSQLLEHLGPSGGETAEGTPSRHLVAALAYERFGRYCLHNKRFQLADSLNGFMMALNGCALFVTDDGHAGVAPRFYAEGDVVLLIAGSSLPFVARKNEDGSYKLLAPGFVYGYMDGEKWTDEASVKVVIR